MKKKGFTMIEMMIVCTILIISLGTLQISGYYIKDYKIKVIEEGFLNEVYSLINYGREKCIYKQSQGEIRHLKTAKEIVFDTNGIEDDVTIKIPKEITYETLTKLKINSTGDLTAMSLNWNGKETGNVYRLSIGVGINMIRVYVNEEERW
ncbi:MAG: prepilin-type N-terminal cleavage/methylation domain-containing protein [Clostridium sp.]|uniref:prepilin-type N-terminal cleavage/methylation domain-containing protein n=1 Tax=Clostridium sp. TaxID=1506 RepID=UPI003EE4F6EA